MPDKYLAIRDNLVSQGKSLKDARAEAAKIYNAERKRGQAPVTGKKEPKK